MKTVILSTNDHPDYVQYLPYAQAAWNMLGWNTLTFYLGTKIEIINSDSEQNRIICINAIEGYRDATILQVYRLFGHQFISSGIIMTSDVDMIPLSNYWHPDKDRIIIYGLNLVDEGQVPMCYVSASVEAWQNMFPERSIKELLEKYPHTKSSEFYDYWFCDQTILHDRIKYAGMTIRSVPRLINNSLPIGRIDRANWEGTIGIGPPYIDAHMLRPFDQEQTDRIMKLIIP